MSALTINPDAAAKPRRVVGAPIKAPPDAKILRWLIYGYLGLWVFEGALRKWIFPSLANPLLVVRDPVLLLMYGVAYAKGFFPRNIFIPWIVGLGALATFVSMATTNTSMVVTLYGLRADYLHLPLIFLLPEVLRRVDLRFISKFALGIAVFMGVLVVLQFRSSSGSFLNAGAGENTVMLDAAFGHVRPSGTFSYTNGLTGFTSIIAGFFLQHLLEKRVVPRAVWLASIPALLVLVLLSGSRLAAATLGLILGTVLIICLVQSRYRASSLKLAALLGVAAFLVGSVAMLQVGLDVFSKRFQSNRVEQHGFFGRYVDGFTLPFEVLDKSEWGGAGLGMGTNVAAGLLTGQRKFMFTEGEGGRVILENGPIVGFAYLMLRLCLVVYLGAQSVRALREHAATLPFLLFSGCFNDLLTGQFSQATELGYATIAGGLCLTACRTAGEPLPTEEPEVVGTPVARPLRPGKRAAEQAVVTPPPASVRPAVSATPLARGRSAYAARLHEKPEEVEREEP